MCDVIIDNGSCENFVSEAMVKALNMPIVKHPSPYKLGWIRKGTRSVVAETCKVPLSIGKTYEEEVVCDVVNRDACHLLLGRPWKFDRDIFHRGTNTCDFDWHGMVITLNCTRDYCNIEEVSIP